MYWQDQPNETSFTVPDDVVDLLFKIDCRRLPLDHAYALSRAILAAAPWLIDTEAAGIHLIHAAESGNGWVRPAQYLEQATPVLELSRRTRFVLRLPQAALSQAESLSGQSFDIDGYSLTLGAARPQLLVAQETVFARYVYCDEGVIEADFLQQCADEIEAMGISIKKMLCGTERQFATPDGVMNTPFFSDGNDNKREDYRVN